MENTTQETEIFVGREEEIALFRKCFEAILPENQGKEEYKDCPRILSFYGESGVGKTTLLSRLTKTTNSILISVEFKKDIFNNDLRVHINSQIANESTATVMSSSIQNSLSYNNGLPLFKKGLFSSFVFDNLPLRDIYIFHNIQTIDNESYDWIVQNFFINFCKNGNAIAIIISEEPQEIFFSKIKKEWFYESQLKPFSFEESKTFLNGFFSQFSDEYLRKIYRYTKGKPEQLQFLVNLVKDKKIPAEAVINELIRNEGKVLSDLKFALEESENLEHKVIAVMTHNLSQKFWALRNDFSSLKHLVEKAGKTQEADDILTRFYQNLDEATGTFQRTYQILENQNIQVAKIKIFDFLNELKVTEAEKNFTIEIIAENPDIEAEIDKNVMKDAFQNLINNAEKHGFKDDTKRYKIVFSLSEFKKEGIEFIRILYQNNGKPFPTHFSFEDYKRLAGKSSTSRGAGIGGYWIKKVIALHKGEWNAIYLHDKTREFPVELEFILPKKQPNK